jgi:hypothetical protein
VKLKWLYYTTLVLLAFLCFVQSLVFISSGSATGVLLGILYGGTAVFAVATIEAEYNNAD